MNARLPVLTPLLLIVGTSGTMLGFAAEPVAINAAGWRIEADVEAQTLRIEQAKLGLVLSQVRLRIGTSKSARIPKWISATSNAERIDIRTQDPVTAWRILASENLLEISSTADNGLVIANAPAPLSRIPARTIDKEGSPVIWQGTDEVASGYGGALTQHVSYLPRLKPEVMHFGLGQISAEGFHSLFDRRSDVAIDFSDDTVLERNSDDLGMLQLTIPVHGNTTIRLRPNYYTEQLGVPYYVPFDDSYFKSAPIVWSSWTSYYEAVTEQDVIRNADWLAEHLKAYGFQYVQLDDGYDRLAHGEHTWIGQWNKARFPHGPQWLTSYIRKKGLRAGLWLVPNAWAGGVQEHPDWYLRTVDGKLILDYNTPTLDSTNPEVLAFEKHLFQTLDNWGFDYYKFDGEHAAAKYIPAVDRSRLFNPSAPLLANYRQRLDAIRETLGPERFIEGCPAGTPLNGIGYFNSYFNGDDLYNNWQGMYPLFSSINANGFLNHIVVYVMPGEGLELGEPMTVDEAERRRPSVVVDTARTRESPLTGFGVTSEEARTLVSYISLTGVAYPLASVMPELTKSRIKLLQATMPTLPILPLDLFSRGTDMRWDKFKSTTPDYYIHNYPEVLDLKIANTLGNYDVVGLTNWRSGVEHRRLQFGKSLGLRPGTQYLVFDFWNEKLLGAFTDDIEVDIASHDTRVLLIYPGVDHPQVIGTSRHLTAAYSLDNVNWNSKERTLSGESQTIAGAPYTLWIHVPPGTRATRVTASVRSGRSQEGELLSVTFDGDGTKVSWSVDFKQ